MKTLILNGSPRISGDTASLLRVLKQLLQGDILELSAFRSRIAPCMDCRACWKTGQCAVDDEMRRIYADDFDNVVLASPVYFRDLPGQVLNVLSRMQSSYAAEYVLRRPVVKRPKKAGLILVGGGKGSEDGAVRHARVLFRLLNAHGFAQHTVLSMQTDTLPAAEDLSAIRGVQALAAWLNDGYERETPSVGADHDGRGLDHRVGRCADLQLQFADGIHGDGGAENAAANVQLDDTVDRAFLNFRNGSPELVSGAEFHQC